MTSSPSDGGRPPPLPDHEPPQHAVDSFPATGITFTDPPCPDRPAAVPAELRDHATYEVVRELGRGGMGVVYLARNKVLDRLEVLKVLQAGLSAREDLLRRFLKEAQLAARVHHPHIVAAYTAFRAGGLLVLAMEYVEGRTLAEVVRDGGPLPVADACRYARQAALGLQQAHEQGMVHRDIKPPNLMLDSRGVVKVLDFGLAKAASERGDAELTGPGAMMGTPDYMAPEQALDAKSADIRADIYSLGCTLFYLLTGQAPFARTSTYEVMRAHQEQPPPALTVPCPQAPAELAALLARMLAKRPDDRPQTPGEVAEALAAFGPVPREDQPPRTPTPTAPPARTIITPRAAPARRAAWPRRAAVGLAALAAVVAGLWAAGAFTRPARKAPPAGGGEVGLGEGDGEVAAGPVERTRLESFTSSVGMKMVLVPAGRFLMGTPDGVPPPRNQKGRRDERDLGQPQHEVVITRPFCLGAFEVTQGQFKQVMGYHPSCFSTDGIKVPGAKYLNDSQPARYKPFAQHVETRDFPVENVGHDEAVEFCRKLTARDRRAGKIRPNEEYRLPSEAQWEYACRAGTTTLYHFGDKLSADHANFMTAERHERRHKTGGSKKVGSLMPNAFGLYDMHGNVWEWCADWYDKDYYKVSPRNDPTGPTGRPAEGKRVARGGGWMNHETQQPYLLWAALRDPRLPGDRNYHLGFRAALVELTGAEVKPR